MPDQKHVVITGCTRGLGRAMVDEFANAGWRISGCGRSEVPIAELAETHGARHFHVVDVADESQVIAFADAVLSESGPPDLFLNNAAIINRSAPLWEISAEEFSDIIDINIKGVASMIRAFLPAMIGRDSGVIVNFSSGWGRSTSPDVAPYCTTKWAIEGMSSALAQELPSGLACVALNPGIIDTEMLRSCFGGGAASYSKPEQWAKTAVPFLAGLDASDNGQALTAP